MTEAATLPQACLQRLSAWAAAGERKILGLVAPPGAGKSTFAQAIHTAFPSHSQIVPMDGFHLANVELVRLGRAARKGAADTFDAGGFLNLLYRIKAQTPEEVIYAPDFRRDLEEAVAGAIAVLASTPLVIVEGNYLLADDAPWAGLRGVFGRGLVPRCGRGGSARTPVAPPHAMGSNPGSRVGVDGVNGCAQRPLD